MCVNDQASERASEKQGKRIRMPTPIMHEKRYCKKKKKRKKKKKKKNKNSSALCRCLWLSFDAIVLFTSTRAIKFIIKEEKTDI